jgi:hypothetical protein
MTSRDRTAFGHCAALVPAHPRVFIQRFAKKSAAAPKRRMRICDLQ